MRNMSAMAMPEVKSFLIGGDFNTNKDQALFMDEQLEALFWPEQPSPRRGVGDQEIPAASSLHRATLIYA